MRNTMLAILAVSAAGAATLAGSGPAAAVHDYPYCIESSMSGGFPDDCSYRSYAQCMASASGRRAECVVNPRFAFGQQQRGRPYRHYERY
jgi:hypothetical protein